MSAQGIVEPRIVESSDSQTEQPQPAGQRGAPNKTQKKSNKRDVHGWVILDKPIGMTSTHAVAVIKRLYAAKRAGHAGTLDPDRKSVV